MMTSQYTLASEIDAKIEGRLDWVIMGLGDNISSSHPSMGMTEYSRFMPIRAKTLILDILAPFSCRK